MGGCSCAGCSCVLLLLPLACVHDRQEGCWLPCLQLVADAYGSRSSILLAIMKADRRARISSA
jgi:hypothetical protein